MVALKNRVLIDTGSPGECAGGEVSFVVNAPGGPSIHGVLAADPMMLVTVVAVVALGMVAIALYVLQLAIRNGNRSPTRLLLREAAKGAMPKRHRGRQES